MLKKRPQSHYRCRCRQCQNRLVFVVSLSSTLLLSTKLPVELGEQALWSSLNSFCNVVNSLTKLVWIQKTNNTKPNNTRSYLNQRQPILVLKRNHKLLQLLQEMIQDRLLHRHCVCSKSFTEQICNAKLSFDVAPLFLSTMAACYVIVEVDMDVVERWLMKMMS